MLNLAAFMLLGQVAAGTPCERLATLTLPNTTITSAQLVAAGPFTPARGGGPAPAAAAPAAGRGAPPAAPAAGRAGGPPGGPLGAPPAMLPEHCRIAATLKPSADSDIKIEVWLPTQTWNGKFQVVGNGGWAGNISFPAMATALQEGYATASTDTGHVGGNALFAIEHPEKLVDFAYRSVHEMTVQAKALINAHYGRAPRLSYWNGCSTGGRQGLMSAQKYPEDFDAIVAGAPANNQTHMHAWDVSVSTPVLKSPESAVPAAKLEVLNKAVLNACDAKDGVKDGVLNDPRSCKFDVASLQCKAGDADNCLTAAQVASVKRVYEPAKTSSGQVLFPGKAFGSETGWAPYVGGQNSPPISVGSFHVAYQNAKWDPLAFDLDRDVKAVDEKVGAIVNAVNPDLSKFKARGGKLIMYHGWNDTAISPGNAIDYYTSVQQKMGGKQDDFIRLFMAPGMQHCGGGPGPNQVNWMAALERWRENGEAPNRINAALVGNNQVQITRPLCPYPQVAAYKGTGSTDEASSFVCK